MRKLDEVGVELAEVLKTSPLNKERLVCLQQEVHAVVEAGIAARKQKLAVLRGACAICGDTRDSTEGWECPGCGSV